MIITEINIAEFGCLKNKVIHPSNGMNVIYGENESGKSTIQLFIKFMLYGLGRRSASNTERERSVSWSGHTAAGSMSFIYSGKEYRIERRYVDGGREALSVIRLDDGEKISTDKTPGEYFLGVPKEVFESSAYVGQGNSSQIDGDKTASSIRNMLTSADESVDTSKILKGLDAIRVSYRHKSKNGGSLYEDEQKIIAQRQRLEKAREATLSLDTWQEKLEVTKRDHDIVKSDLEAKDAILSQLNKVTVLKRFDRLSASEKKLDDLDAQRKALVEDALKTDTFPTRDHLAEIKVSAKSLEDATERFRRASNNAQRPESEGYSPADVDMGEHVESLGGAERILNDIAQKKEKIKKQNGMITAVWITQAVLSMCGGALLVSGFVWAAAFFAFVAPAVITTVVGANTKKRLWGEISAIASELGTVPEKISEKLDACAKALAEKRRSLAYYARADVELSMAENELERCKSRVCELLELTLIAPDVSVEAAMTEVDRLAEFLSEYDRISKDHTTLSELIENERAALSGYDAKTLRSEITVNIDEVTPAAIAEAERVRSFLSAKKNSLEQRLTALNSNVIQLRMSAEDPLPIADALCALEESYAKDKEFYEALTLAMEAIEQAGQSLSGSVTPAIAKRAGGIMGYISDGKYGTLRATDSFDLSLDSDGFGIKSEYLSAGTRDAAYLSLRIALMARIYGENMPPLILDEALCRLDDTRAKRFVEMLGELSAAGMQSICFTSQRREEALCNELGVDHLYIAI